CTVRRTALPCHGRTAVAGAPAQSAAARDRRVERDRSRRFPCPRLDSRAGETNESSQTFRLGQHRGSPRASQPAISLPFAFIPRTPSLVVQRFNQAVVAEILQRAIERSGPEPHTSVAEGVNLTRDGESVSIARGERQEDVVPRRLHGWALP